MKVFINLNLNKMEASLLLVIISIVVGVFLVLSIFNISDNTKKTNKLLRLLLNEQNPERFELTNFGKLKDTKLNTKY